MTRPNVRDERQDVDPRRGLKTSKSRFRNNPSSDQRKARITPPDPLARLKGLTVRISSESLVNQRLTVTDGICYTKTEQDAALAPGTVREDSGTLACSEQGEDAIEEPTQAARAFVITSATRHQQRFSTRNTEVQGTNNAAPITQGVIGAAWHLPGRKPWNRGGDAPRVGCERVCCVRCFLNNLRYIFIVRRLYRI